MKIRWKPTEIGGEIGKHDFCASVMGVVLGRISRTDMTNRKNVWEWNFFCGAGDMAQANRGVADTKQDAADRVRERFELFISIPTDQGGGMGLEPEEMLSDASGLALSKMKARDDPEAFWQRINDIRAGKVDRNFHRWIHDKTPLRPLEPEDY